MSVLLNGTFFDEQSNTGTEFTPPELVYGVPTKMFNLQLTQYTLNTFLEAAASTARPIDIAALLAIDDRKILSTIDLGYWIP